MEYNFRNPSPKLFQSMNVGESIILPLYPVGTNGRIVNRAGGKFSFIQVLIVSGLEATKVILCTCVEKDNSNV